MRATSRLLFLAALLCEGCASGCGGNDLGPPPDSGGEDPTDTCGSGTCDSGCVGDSCGDTAPPDDTAPFDDTGDSSHPLPTCTGRPLRGRLNLLEADEIHEGTQEGAEFGHALANAGDQDGDGRADLFVGAPEEGDVGAAYLLRSSDARRIRFAGLELEEPMGDADYSPNLGWALVDVLPGAPACEPLVLSALYLNANGEDSGAVFFIEGCPTDDVDVTRLRGDGFVITGDGANHYRGQELAAGDLNGDGERDVLLLNPGNGSLNAQLVMGARSEAGAWQPGQTQLFHPEHIRVRSAAFTRLSEDNGGTLIIGDGKSDLDGLTNNGSVRLFRYSDLGMSTALWEPSHTLSDELEEGHFGDAVASGDFDGDGLLDVVVGARAPNTGLNGAVFLYRGVTLAQTTGQAELLWASDYATEFSGQLPDENFGLEISMADLNHDGLDDVLVSSSNSNSNDTAETWAYVIFGAAEPAPRDLATQTADLWVSGLGETGSLLKAIGDRNGDGCEDFAVSAPHLDVDGLNRAGAVYVFYGWSDAP